MANSGDVIENPMFGMRITFRETGVETNGELLRMEAHIEPTKGYDQPHMHPGTEERITVVNGLMKGMFDGEDKAIQPGETLRIPPGTPHVFQAEGETDIVFEFRPARRIETLFETLFGLARDGKVPKSGRPRLLQTAAIFKEYKHEIRPAGAPDFILKVIDGFAPLARALGRRAWYPEYTRSVPPKEPGGQPLKASE
jgi:quercetin dioxygenase-like cupin family protein